MSPGKTVVEERSITVAFAGILRSLPTAWIVSPLIRMIWLVINFPFSVSISLPAFMAVTRAVCPNEEIVKKRKIRKWKRFMLLSFREGTKKKNPLRIPERVYIFLTFE